MSVVSKGINNNNWYVAFELLEQCSFSIYFANFFKCTFSAFFSKGNSS